MQGPPPRGLVSRVGRSSAWDGRLTSKVVEPRGDEDALGLVMVRYDLLFSSAGALDDFP